MSSFDAKDASDEVVPGGLATHVDEVFASHRPREASVDDDDVRTDDDVAAQPRVQLLDVLVRRYRDFSSCNKQC